MKHYLTVIILAVCLGLLGGCKSPEKPKQTAFFTWTDAYGRDVTVAQKPQRIVSLSPAITEIVCWIGAEDKLVGVSDYCNYPESVRKIQRVGGMQNINLESLISLRPDVVLIGSIVSKKDVDAIEKMGIPVVTVKEEGDIEGMAGMIEVIGKITGCTVTAAEKAQAWRDRVAKLKNRIPENNARRKRVYYVVGFGDAGDYTAPKTSHIHQIIELAGCENVGAELSTWNVSREFLFQAAPDIIIVRAEDKETFCRQYPYTLLDAVKNDRVYAIESGWIDVVSPRNLRAVEFIQSLTE